MERGSLAWRGDDLLEYANDPAIIFVHRVFFLNAFISVLRSRWKIRLDNFKLLGHF